MLILLGIMNRWHNTWWLAGAALMSVWLVIQSLLWPVIIAPMFNKFEPVHDQAIMTMVRELADKAELPVDQVFIMDASRRTIKANAYFAGVGHTKRVVLYDTLLANYSFDEIKAVLAHEFAHWRQNHIVKGLLLGIIGNFLFWGILYTLLRSVMPGQTPNPPHTLAVIMFIILSLSFVINPWVNYISRNMETEADRIAVELTDDVQAAIRLQKNLALRNFSDLSPAPFIEWFSYSHPPAAKRMDNIRQTGEPTTRR